MSQLDPLDTQLKQQQQQNIMSPNESADPSESRNIFILGLCVLFGWMIVILICASPHLFRNYLKKWIFKHEEDDPVTEKIRKAEARLQETLRLAQKPSTFLVDQAALMTTMVNEEKMTETRLDLVEEEDEDESSQEPTTSTNL